MRSAKESPKIGLLHMFLQFVFITLYIHMYVLLL